MAHTKDKDFAPGLKRFFFHCPGMAYAGNVYGKDEREARAQARASLKVERLPAGTAVWEG